MLETADLEWMREANEQLLPDTCTVKARTLTSDGSGGMTESWTTGTSYTCRVDFETGVIQSAGGGVQSYSKTVLWLPHDAVVNVTDRIVWSAKNYTISSIQLDSWMTLTKVELNAI